jgi:hypothetical protein
VTLRIQIQRLAFSLVMFAFFVAVLVSTSNFRLVVAGYFPGFAALLGLASVALLLVVETLRVVRTWRREQHEAGTDESTAGASADVDEIDAVVIAEGRFLRTALWVVAAVVAVAAFGLLYGAGVFLAAFLRFEGKETWRYTVLATAVALGFLFATVELFSLQLPESLFVVFF